MEKENIIVKYVVANILKSITWVITGLIWGQVISLTVSSMLFLCLINLILACVAFLLTYNQ